MPGSGVRPTSDMVREALFSILGPRVATGAFLDLYAGSGAVGIEAISRGAPSATFVERDRKAVRVIRENLETCRFAGRARIVERPVTEALDRRLVVPSDYAIVFCDPPYGSEEGGHALIRLAGALKKAQTTPLLILEHASRNPPGFGDDSLKLSKSATYGDTALSFFEVGGGV